MSRIPKDEKGEPIYEQTDAETAWDGLIEQAEGDEEMAHEVADDMVKEKTADLEKIEKEPITQGKTPTEKIAARKAHKAKVEQAKQELEHWKAIANVQAERKAKVEAEVAEDAKEEEVVDKASEEPKPIGKGVFGNIYDQFKGKAKAAFDFLLKHKEGDLQGVFHRKGIGDIDVVWGDKGGGFYHLISKHIGKGKSFSTIYEAAQAIDEIIKTGKIDFRNGDRIVFRKGSKLVTIRTNVRENGKKIADKNWVLTAYDELSADGDVSAIAPVNQGQAARTTDNSRHKGTTKKRKAQEKEDVSIEALEKEYEKLADKGIELEAMWEDKIGDYIVAHYPHVDGVRARTAEQQALYDAERKAMKEDAVLKKMQEDEKSELDAHEVELSRLYHTLSERKKSAANDNKTTQQKPRLQKASVEIETRDKKYLEAVKRGDMETAQRMVNEAAEKAGYSTDSSYQGSSAFNGAAPYGNAYFLTKAERKEAWDNDEWDGYSTIGDYIDNGVDAGNLEMLTNAYSYRAADPMRKEAIENVRDVVENKKRTITMYRSVPSSVKEGKFRNGDWITPSRKYAIDNAQLHGWGEDYRIIEQEVPIDDVWFDGNDIAEWGYGREEDYVNDKDFAYKNTQNNRKLLTPVTYDNEGNVIPLSERFNSNKADERYQKSEGVAPVSHNERVLRDEIVDRLNKMNGISTGMDVEQAQRKLDEIVATNSNVKFHKETDKDTLKHLNKGKTIKAYRAMQVIDGKLYPPMAAMVDGNMVESNTLGEWIRADENPDLAIPDIDPKTGVQKIDSKGELKWKFKLDKGSKDATGKKATSVNAAYNPYWHMSRSPLNDQFKSAWIRPNIVVVECEFPESELTSGYKAEKAKDAVGEVDWKSGSVSGEVFKQTGRARKVILSRWCKPVRILSDAEVAQRAKEFVGKANVVIPQNVLTPKQRIAFEEAGFKIGAPEKGVNMTEQIAEALEAGLKVDNNVLDESKPRFFRTKDGEAYGFTIGGKIYIDPRIATSETPIHEYAHLWATALRQGNAEEWQNVVGLMKGTSVWDEVKKTYPELQTDDELADEVLAQYSGRRGAERLRAEAKKIAEEKGDVLEKADAISALERVKQAINAFWKGVCDFLHIHYTNAEEVADRVMKDLLDGVDPRKFGVDTNLREMGSRTNKRMAEIGKHYKDKTLTDEEQAIVDVFSGKKDRQAIEITNDEGTSIHLEMRQGNEQNAGTKHSIFRHVGKDNGSISYEELKLIPYVIKTGERTDKGANVVYQKKIDGVRYTVYTDKKGSKEIFHDFYSNRKTAESKSLSGNSTNTQSSARTDDNADYNAKVDNSSESPKVSYEKVTDDNHPQQMTDYAHDVAESKQSTHKTLVTSGSYFSGGGLLEEGLKGIINPQVAVEFNEKIAGVYADNHGNHIVTADVRNVDPSELVKHIDGEVQYFHASPVCKNFSTAKRNAGEVGIDIETAQSTADFIHKIRPKVVTIENVKGYRKGKSLEIILQALKDEGYKYDVDVYNAADFGGYTNRERLIVRAVRDGELPEKPKPIAVNLRPKGWMDAVDDLIGSLPERKSGVPAWMDTRLKGEGIDWRNIDKPLYVFGQGNNPHSVSHAFADELLPTLRTGGSDVIIMPDGRVLKVTPRVLARVTGLSDDYKMPQTDTLAHIVVGNGIPTQLTRGVIAPLLRSAFNEDTSVKGGISEDVDFSKREDVEKVNDTFNEDLKAYIEEGILPKNSRFELGFPSVFLLSAGFPYLPISMRASLLNKKAGMERHPFSPSDLYNMVVAIQKPLVIFEYSKNNMRNLIVDLTKGEKHFLVGVTLDYRKGELAVNSVSGLFPKESHEWIKWIQDKKAIRIDQKEKVLSLIDSLRTNPEEAERIGLNLDYTANLVKNFENPKVSDEKVTDDNHLHQMTNYAHDVAEALNVNGDVEVVTSEGLTGKKKQAKGWYDPKTGKITIVADNHTSMADMEQTMLHEAVAHKGLRVLFGERFTTFLDNVFTNADADVRQGITDLMSKNNWDARKATEEYLASLAETTNFEEAKKNGVWEKIKDFFRDLLDAVGLSGFSGKLSDNELRYILWSSYENLKHGDISKEMLAQAKDIAKQKELGVGQFAKEDTETENDGVLFRGKDSKLPERHTRQRYLSSG